MRMLLPVSDPMFEVGYSLRRRGGPEGACITRLGGDEVRSKRRRVSRWAACAREAIERRPSKAGARSFFVRTRTPQLLSPALRFFAPIHR